MIEINGEEKEIDELTTAEWGLVAFAVLFALVAVGAAFLVLLPFFVTIGGFLLVVLALVLVGAVLASVESGIESLIGWIWKDD